MYWLVFVIIAICCLLEIRKQKINSSVFYFIYGILVLMTVLRQGQGSDYYNYMEIYKEVDYYTTNYSAWSLLVTKDPLYSLINYIAISLNISYKAFSAIISFLIMALLYRFYNVTCNKSSVCIFMLYTTFYLVYPFSGIRQGLTIAILLGILYPLLKQGKLRKYYFVLFLASFIHQSILICIILPLIYKIRIKQSSVAIITIICTIIMLLGVNILNMLPMPDFLLDRSETYMESQTTTKYLSIIVRMLVILPLFMISENIYKKHTELNGVKNILFAGYVVYSILSFSDLIASRMAVYFRVFEGLFIYLLLFNLDIKRVNRQIGVYYFFIATILFTKDINAFITQGEYRHCNIITYPYLTIFDDRETIMYYRHNLSSADRIE